MDDTLANLMKYALVMVLMSLSAIVLALQHPVIAAPLCWIALSFTFVAAAYGGLGARIFGKRADGSIPWHRKLLILPYLLFTGFVWHLVRVTSREDALNTIDKNLVVGRRLLASEITDGFDHYVDLTAEFEDPKEIRQKECYRCFPILDADIPTIEELAAAVQTARDGKTYIHCAQGHGRTGIFALALLAERNQLSNVEEGLSLLKQFRPAIELNPRQTEFVRTYLAKTFGS